MCPRRLHLVVAATSLVVDVKAGSDGHDIVYFREALGHVTPWGGLKRCASLGAQTTQHRKQGFQGGVMVNHHHLTTSPSLLRHSSFSLLWGLGLEPSGMAFSEHQWVNR